MLIVDEFKKAADELGLECHVLGAEKSKCFIEQVTDKFGANKLSGHVAINHDSVNVPLEPHEFSFSENLRCEPVFLFFDQLGQDRELVVVLQEGQSLGKVLENAFGMEYFVSNETQEYLLAVNWYVIEGAGTAREWLSRL
jgi:hypothetical protein